RVPGRPALPLEARIGRDREAAPEARPVARLGMARELRPAAGRPERRPCRRRADHIRVGVAGEGREALGERALEVEEPASGRVPLLPEVGVRELTPTTHGVARRRRRRRRPLWPYLYALPALGAMAFAFGFPLVQVVRDSFYAGDFTTSPIWVGLDNYKGVVSDPQFQQSLLNNLKLMLTVPIMLGLGLAIALVLNDRIRG